MSEKEKKKKKEEPVEKEKKPVNRRTRKPKEPDKIEFPEVFAVVGADLSLRRPGYGVLLVNNGKIIDVFTESIDNKTAKKCRGEILAEIFARFPVIKNGVPAFYVREHAFNGRGAMSEIGIFEVVGVADMALWFTCKKEWTEIYPVTVKKLLTGSGQATKEEVAASLDKYLGKREYANDDESDAAAVAVAFLIQNGVVKPKGDESDEQTENQMEK